MSTSTSSNTSPEDKLLETTARNEIHQPMVESGVRIITKTAKQLKAEAKKKAYNKAKIMRKKSTIVMETGIKLAESFGLPATDFIVRLKGTKETEQQTANDENGIRNETKYLLKEKKVEQENNHHEKKDDDKLQGMDHENKDDDKRQGMENVKNKRENAGKKEQNPVGALDGREGSPHLETKATLPDSTKMQRDRECDIRSQIKALKEEGDQLAFHGDHVAACRNYYAAIRLVPGEIIHMVHHGWPIIGELVMRLGNSKFILMEYVTARKAFADVIQRFRGSKNPLAHFRIGQIDFELYEGAIEEQDVFEKTIKTLPIGPERAKLRGKLEASRVECMKSFTTSMEYFEAAISLGGTGVFDGESPRFMDALLYYRKFQRSQSRLSNYKLHTVPSIAPLIPSSSSSSSSQVLNSSSSTSSSLSSSDSSMTSISSNGNSEVSTINGN